MKFKITFILAIFSLILISCEKTNIASKPETNSTKLKRFVDILCLFNRAEGKNGYARIIDSLLNIDEQLRYYNKPGRELTITSDSLLEIFMNYNLELIDSINYLMNVTNKKDWPSPLQLYLYSDTLDKSTNKCYFNLDSSQIDTFFNANDCNMSNADSLIYFRLTDARGYISYLKLIWANNHLMYSYKNNRYTKNRGLKSHNYDVNFIYEETIKYDSTTPFSQPVQITNT